MSSRVVGAGLALIAAALFAVSMATPAVLPAELSLFAGHRTVNGHTLEMQDAYVGFYKAQVCNTGGDGTCQNANPRIAFKFASFAELGVTGLAAVFAVVLALLTLRKSERRKAVARFVRILTVIAVAGAGAMIFLGPTDQGTIPLGLGMGLYGAGLLGAFLASVIAVRPTPPIKLRVADRGSQPVAAIPAARLVAELPARQPIAAIPASPGPLPFDVQALFGEDPPRPGEIGPEPMMQRDAWVHQGPAPGGGEFEEPADPFATTSSLPGVPGLPGLPSGDKPLFASAPQLRPLYEATPLQGGTGGLLPIERPVIPTRPPTPVSRASISEAAGLPTSPRFSAGRPKTMPPPNFGVRGKPASIPPPLPPGAAPRTQVSLVPPMPDNGMLALPVAQLAPAAPAAPLPPGVSDGRPEAAEATSNTEPNLFPAAEDPPQVPRAPAPRPRVETPLAEPPPPVAQAPRARRVSPPLPRPMRDTQSPRPGLRAAVPMPERSARQAPGSTRPPPLSIGPLASPPRGAPPRTTLAGPAVPSSIPPIPAIPAIPAIPMVANRAETDPQDRAETVEQGIDPATGSHDPIEIGDHTSQTNVSFGMVTAEELDAAVEAAGTPPGTPGAVRGGADLDEASEPSGPEPAAAAELGFFETTTASAPIEPLDEAGRALSSTDVHSAMAPPPAAAPPAPLPAATVAPPAPLVRDRPMPKLPISTAPDSLPPPKDQKQQMGPSPACPQCESPMAWVEEHLRFYCKSCRMYF